jgi:hypothetical protein
LTVRQRKFAAELAQGKTQRQAAIEAGVPPGGASAFAQRALKSAHFQETFEQMLDRVGLSEQRLAEIHLENTQATKVVAVARSISGEVKEIVERPDYSTRQKAVADGWRLRGRIGSGDGDGNDASPIRIQLTMETIRKVEALTGRKVLPANFEVIEDDPEPDSPTEASADDSTPPTDANGQAENAVWGDW